MASKSYPRPGYNGGSLSSAEHERLEFPSKADALYGYPNDSAPVFADGTGTRVVKVRAGLVAYLRGGVYESGSTDIAFPSLAENTSGQPRIDLVTLRLDRSTYEIKETVITGTPAANPVAPAMAADTGTTGFYDLPLAEVRVTSGATALAATTVTTKAWYIGLDGQYRCKSTARPPHHVGRRIFEIDTGRDMISTGTTWLVVAEHAAGVLETNAGITHPTKRLYRRNGQATMALTVARSGAPFNPNQGYVIGRVPAGFLPVEQMPFVGVVPSVGQVFTGSVETDGRILLNAGDQSIPTGRYCVLQTLTWPVA